MVGAILTQNTAWVNVERAIGNLAAAGAVTPTAILQAPVELLASWLRPSGYFNVKARRLRNFCHWYVKHGGEVRLARLDTECLRRELLSVHGIGPETADDILLYAFRRRVFVIDAYTRRITARLGIISGQPDYETLRRIFESALSPNVEMFNEFHALFVRHGKYVCRTKPLCDRCCLARVCSTGAAGHRQLTAGKTPRRGCSSR
jgi:endonuclease-3 related protein